MSDTPTPAPGPGSGPGSGRAKAIPDHPNVYRFLSGHSFEGGPPCGTGAPLVYLHIPKTGGTYLTDVLLHNLQRRDQPDLFYAPHRMTVAQTAEVFGPSRQLALVLRDPLSRFVSAWHSRLREGKPGYHTPWTAAEAQVFATFPDLEALARGLGHLWPGTRRRARAAVAAMTMVPRGYAHAFGTPDAARRAMPAVRLCLPIEALDSQLDVAMAALGFPDFSRPPQPVENRSTERPPPLSARAEARLRAFLAEDYAIYDVLSARARELHG